MSDTSPAPHSAHVHAQAKLQPSPWLICEECDTPYRRRPLARGEVAYCARCDALLERHAWLSNNAMLALVTTALVVFIQANVWPIVTLGLGGQHSSARLWGTIIMMWREHSQIVATITAFTLFFFPLLKMLSLGWLLLYARGGRRAPGFRPIMVTLYYLGPWTMSEVFVLGALVAIVKARAYFDVLIEPGIFAYAVLTLLITVFAGIDLRGLWNSVAEADDAPGAAA